VNALIRTHSDRTHGLTENDDVRELMEKISSASQCALGAQGQAIISHARLVEYRLSARGAVDELLTLANIVDGSPVSGLHTLAEEIRAKVRLGPEAARSRLMEHAALLAAEAVSSEDRLRAQLAQEAWVPGTSATVDNLTRAFVAFARDDRSCVAVLPALDLPEGMVTFSLMRGASALALYGDSPVMHMKAGKRPRALVLCTAERVLQGDRLLATGGWQYGLETPSNAVARGLAVQQAGQRTHSLVCDNVIEADAKAVCAWTYGSRP
jgi:hypothetical protein